MKKILVSTLLISVTMIISGCGSSSSKDSTDLDNAKVEFKNSAKYDLSEYMAQTSQTNNYVKKVFKDDSGKGRYKDKPDETKYYYEKYDVNGSKVKIFSTDDNETSDIEILSDKIIYKSDDLTINTARFVDSGDYIAKVSKSEDGIGMRLVSKLIKHIDSKVINDQTYNDVLELKTIIKTTGSTTLNTKKYDYTSTSTITDYIAKGVDEIESIDEECEETKSEGKIIEKSCTKELTQLTTINK